MSSESEGHLPGVSPTGPLRPSFPVWGLFGRGLLYVVGQVLVVPAPWTATGFYRFLCEHVSLPDGRRLRFAGQPGDIWYILVGLAALGWLHNVQHAGVSGAVTLATILLTVPVVRWFCASVRTADGRLSSSSSSAPGSHARPFVAAATSSGTASADAHGPYNSKSPTSTSFSLPCEALMRALKARTSSAVSTSLTLTKAPASAPPRTGAT